MLRKLLVSLGVAQALAASPAAADALREIREIREMLWDRSARFSISETLARIDAIEEGVAEPDPELRGELAYARAYLHSRRYEFEPALAAYDEALAIHDETPFLPERVAISARLGRATQLEDLARWKEAVEAWRAAIPLVEASDAHDENELAGTKERLAYALHEAGEYEEAEALNREVIETGERLFGDDVWQLMTALINLAQNLHAQDRPAEARPVLLRVLGIARDTGDAQREASMLFQLGVLDFEMGDPESAEAWFRKAVEHARATGDAYLLEDAERDLAEFERRRAAGE